MTTAHQDYVSPNGWSLARAMHNLGVYGEEFRKNGNEGADGYSYDQILAIRPNPGLWSVPVIATHELAHIVLGHTRMSWLGQSNQYPRMEIEAHLVALLATQRLDVSKADQMVPEILEYLVEVAEEADRLGVAPLNIDDEAACAIDIIVNAGF